MKTLIIEDDASSRLLMKEFLKSYGSSHTVINGREAVEIVSLAMESGDPFNLICLDIMMPEMNGQEVLRQIREKENAMGIPACDRVKIVMTTALSEQIQTATDDQHQYDAYLTKPIGKAKLLEELRRLKLIP